MAAEAARCSTADWTLFAKTVRDQRRSLVWWGVGFVGSVLTYAAFWPTIRGNAAQFNDYIAKLPEAVRNLIGGDYATPHGYVQAEMFSLLLPILSIVYAIGAGARAIAGEEEGGTLDLLLSAPITRRQILLQKFEAMAGVLLALTGISWVAIVSIGRPFGLTVGLITLAAATVNLFLLAAVFGSVALAIGAATGTKGTAIGATSGVALGTFVVQTLSPIVAAIAPLRFLSPFYYYSAHKPLTNGFDPVDVIVLAGISVAALGSALISFDRRDLSNP